MSPLWTIKERLIALILAFTDKRTPATGKLLAVLSLAYLLSPIDVLADMVPLVGLVDDIIIVPLGIWLARTRIPAGVWREAQKRAHDYDGKLNRLLTILIVLITVWLLIAIFLAYLLIHAMLLQ